MHDEGGRPITGRQVLLFTIGAFGVIVAVNLTMAWKAVSTFPGLEVKNSYVASQGWNAARDAQAALGWRLTQEYRDGVLTLRFTDAAGLPAPVASVAALVGRATAAQDDMVPDLRYEGGVYVADAPLKPGRWMVRVEARAADGTAFRQRLTLTVRG
ncbi:MAG TPA: FixH family protein [Paracoccaceae bacterium]|nr:FixH family protein [Paracoccaceae bacterium]HMO70444.1 FixH family protein [Paracoccaceae bacterium]